MGTLTFTAPSEEHARDVLAYRAESLRYGCGMDGSAGLGNFPDYGEWLSLVRLLAGARAEKFGYYRTSVRLAYDGELLAGILNVRRSEDASIRAYAGHIGYHVRPSCRGRGYGPALAAEAVRMCGGYGIARPVICVMPGNTASRRVAEKAGFVPAGEGMTEAGVCFVRYELR